MLYIVVTLRRASRSASLNTERLAVVPAYIAHVTTIAIAVKRGIDRRVPEVGISNVARGRLLRVDQIVPIAACDDDGEVTAGFAGVDSVGSVDGGAP